MGLLRMGAFRIGFEGEHCHQTCQNLRSAKQHPKIVEAKIQKEFAEGRIAALFVTSLLRT